MRGPLRIAAGRGDFVAKLLVIGLGNLVIVEVVEIAEDAEEAPGHRGVPHASEIRDGAADAPSGGKAGSRSAGGMPTAQLGLHPVITHQTGEIGGVRLVAANVGVRVDDRGVGDHPIDTLGQAGFAGEHGRLGGDEKVGLRASVPTVAIMGTRRAAVNGAASTRALVLRNAAGTKFEAH